MKQKTDCCRKYERKSDACKRCPLTWGLTKKRRKKRIRKLRERRAA